jgi:hypothetical protein
MTKKNTKQKLCYQIKYNCSHCFILVLKYYLSLSQGQTLKSERQKNSEVIN